MNDRQQQALQAAKTKLQQDYGMALAMYRNPEPEISQHEAAFVLNELKLMRLKQTASTLAAVIRRLEPATRKSNCGCSGKSGSAGRETKSLYSAGDRPHFFAMEMQRQQDEAYERFCAKFPDMCKG